MGELGHGHGAWVMAQLSHYVAELGHETIICFIHDYSE